jgi:8-oxo-dGTP pyrophosphatase MutT (NUDIX family)
MSAGVILVDPRGRVLMQLRDNDPKIMFPGYWGLTGGAALAGETPEQTARREVAEETGLTLDRFDAFRAYYSSDPKPGKKPPAPGRADYELYMFHAPCGTPVEELVCGEGRELRFFSPDELPALDIAYNHREVLSDFFASPAYARYLAGEPTEANGRGVEPLDRFRAEIESGAFWFEALMDTIAVWERAEERAGGREYRYLVGGEAFDWLLLAERLLADPCAESRVPADAARRLLFEGLPPDGEGRTLDDERLRSLIGDAKHRAHLNYVYGVTVEEALQYAVELDVSKERRAVSIKDPRDDETALDPVFERIYGLPRAQLLARFREECSRPRAAAMTLSELREFQYWLFKYRVANSEPARVASDTRKALAQLSAIEDAARRSRRLREAGHARAQAEQVAAQ